MQHYSDRSTMGTPGVCFICETTPPEGTGYVDTLRNFTPGIVTTITGAKYVCDGCVKALAETAGFYASEDVEAAQARADEAVGKFHQVVDYVGSIVAGLEFSVLHAEAAKAPIVVAAQSALADVATAEAEVAPEVVAEVPVEPVAEPAEVVEAPAVDVQP